jgi:hypothetical protein
MNQESERQSNISHPDLLQRNERLAITGRVLHAYIDELTTSTSQSIEKNPRTGEPIIVERNKFGTYLIGLPDTVGFFAELPLNVGLDPLNQLHFSRLDYTIDNMSEGPKKPQMLVEFMFDTEHPSNFTVLTNLSKDTDSAQIRLRETTSLTVNPDGNIEVDVDDFIIQEHPFSSTHMSLGDERLKDDEFTSKMVRLPASNDPVDEYEKINNDPLYWQEYLLIALNILHKTYPDEYPQFDEYMAEYLTRTTQGFEIKDDTPPQSDEPPISRGFIRPKNK